MAETRPQRPPPDAEHPSTGLAPRDDAFAQLLGIRASRQEEGTAEARVRVAAAHLNPHGTTHGALIYSLAGIALAAAANDAVHSGVVSAVHIDYLSPSSAGDELVATARVAERLPREDIFEVRVVRSPGGDVVAGSAAAPPAAPVPDLAPCREPKRTPSSPAPVAGRVCARHRTQCRWRIQGFPEHPSLGCGGRRPRGAGPVRVGRGEQRPSPTAARVRGQPRARRAGSSALPGGCPTPGSRAAPHGTRDRPAGGRHRRPCS